MTVSSLLLYSSLIRVNNFVQTTEYIFNEYAKWLSEISLSDCNVNFSLKVF